MLVVGLTGGIGSGKSVVANLFANHGAGVIDTDVIAHRLTQANGAAIAAIQQTFQARLGEALLTDDGALNRAAMRDLVFHDAAARQQLEAILHPLIRADVVEQVGSLANQHPYLIVVVPLLIEAPGWREQVDRIAVVDCDPAIQLHRVVGRGNISEQQARAVIAAQASRAERLTAADDIIDNAGSVADLSTPIATLDQRYRALAGR